MQIYLAAFILYLSVIFINFAISDTPISSQDIDLLTNVSLGKADNVRALLIDSTPEDLDEALLIAMQNGHQAIAKLLLDHGASVKQIQGNLNAVDVLIFNNDKETISSIIKFIDPKYYQKRLGYHIWRGINDYEKQQQSLNTQPSLKSSPTWKILIRDKERGYEVSKYLASKLATTGSLSTAINMICERTFPDTRWSFWLPHINHLVQSSKELIPEMVVSCVARGGKIADNIVRLIITDKKMITKNIDTSVLDENVTRVELKYKKSNTSLLELSNELDKDNYIHHYFNALTKNTSTKDGLGNYTTLNQYNANQKTQEGTTQLMLSMLLKLDFYDTKDMRLQDFKSRISTLKNFNVNANTVDEFGKTFIDYIDFHELEGPMKLDIVNQYFPDVVREYINRNLSKYINLSDDKKLVTLIAAIVTNRVDVIDKLSVIDKARFKIYLRGYSNTPVAYTVASKFNRDLAGKIYNIGNSR